MSKATMAICTFWDNAVFFTHANISFINRPKSLWWNKTVVSQSMINWRARADLFAFCAALVEHIIARRKRDSLQKKALASGPNAQDASDASSALAAAEAKCHETRYPLVKYC